MADNDLDTWQKLENLALRTHIFANAVSKPAGVAFLTVHFRVNPGDTLGDDLQLDLETRSGRHGIAFGTSLSQMLTEAEEALFQIDEVLQGLGVVI